MFAHNPLDKETPTLSAIDPRGLPVRTVAYCRSVAHLTAQARVTRQIFNPAAQLVANWDPRLISTSSTPNLVSTFSLGAQLLLSKSVDSGWRVKLYEIAGGPLCEWDGRHNLRLTEYDRCRRPVTITEHAGNAPPSVTERLTYADASPEFAAHNLCGKLLRHDDPAGCLMVNDYGLAGAILSQSRRLLKNLQTPDWQPDPSEREQLLEAKTATTRWQFNPTGEVLSQRDARNNATLMAYDVAGQLRQIQLKQANLSNRTVLRQVLYNAFGQIEQQTAGNGVQTLRRYDPHSGRLLQLTTRLAAHCYQDEQYDYDPVGNIIHIDDTAQPVRHFRNQRNSPVSTYRYDSLYQLIEATGRESIPSNQGPGLPELHTPVLDPTRMATYAQTYDYDAAGNLQILAHEGNSGYRRQMLTSALSNRSLLKTEMGEPDFGTSFDANGNLQWLAPGANTLQWDSRNQLHQVVQVHRDDADNDGECYSYDAQGQRLRKVNTRKTRSVTNTLEVRYFPGLEVHSSNLEETHHVIHIETGNSSVRILHWPQQPPADIPNNQIGYHSINPFNTSMLELGDNAQVLSQEGYYPYGGTAWWAAKNQNQANYKTIRYSMKERDLTGLYYYGSRYYAPWLQRWINPDPAGTVDGLNLFRFSRNNPIRYRDPDGGLPVINGSGPDDIRLPPGMTEAQIKTIEINNLIGPKTNDAVVIHQIPVPKQFKLDPRSELTFNMAGPGTAFTAIANIHTGDIYFAPLESNLRSMPPTNRTRYESVVSDVYGRETPSPPITHVPVSNPSHLQLSTRIGLNQKNGVGFALTRGLTGQIYNMTFLSRSSNNKDLEGNDSTSGNYSTAAARSQYKFVTQRVPGDPASRTHNIDVLPRIWADAIADFLKTRFGRDRSKTNPNPFINSAPPAASAQARRPTVPSTSGTQATRL